MQNQVVDRGLTVAELIRELQQIADRHGPKTRVAIVTYNGVGRKDMALAYHVDTITWEEWEEDIWVSEPEDRANIGAPYDGDTVITIANWTDAENEAANAASLVDG